MSLRRPDWLAQLQLLLTLALLLGAVGVVGSLVWGFAADNVTLTIPASGIDGMSLRGTNVRGAVEIDGLLDLRVTDPTTTQRGLSVVSRLLGPALGIAMLALLRGAVRTARRVDPFSDAVLRRLRWLGIIVLVGGALTDAARVVLMVAISETVLTDAFAAMYVSSWWWLLTGFGFLAMAEIVRRGAAMRAELDEVV